MISQGGKRTQQACKHRCVLLQSSCRKRIPSLERRKTALASWTLTTWSRRATTIIIRAMQVLKLLWNWISDTKPYCRDRPLNKATYVWDKQWPCIPCLFCFCQSDTNTKDYTGWFICSETWVWSTLIWVFHHLAELHSRFWQILINPSRTMQTAEQLKSKLTQPRSRSRRITPSRKYAFMSLCRISVACLLVYLPCPAAAA